MLTAKLYTDEWEIDSRLAEFNFTRAELTNVLIKTLAERSNSLEVDVLNAPGTLAYIHGSRHLRLLAREKGYQINREKNIESSLNPKCGIKIAYQNVDLAASEHNSPLAISGKKAGSAKAIEEAQGTLFATGKLPEAFDLSKVQCLNSSLWYLCASYDGESVRGELSLPVSIAGDNFSGFLERIFITQGSEWIGVPSTISDEDMVEFEPQISRK